MANKLNQALQSQRTKSIIKKNIINKLTIITESIPGAMSVSINFLIKVGSAYENSENNGIAHFTEHLLFRGTKNKTSEEIAIALDNMGGHYNACTSNDYTMVYSKISKNNMDESLEIICDMIANSKFENSDIEQESKIVAREISESTDDPYDNISDLFMSESYKNQSMGMPILGTLKFLSSANQNTIRDFVNKYYTRDRMIIVACGDVDHEEFCNKVDILTKDIPTNNDSNIEPEPINFISSVGFKKIKLNQWYCMWGFRLKDQINRKQFYANKLFVMILGQGMSSILFREIREKRSLTYFINSSLMAKRAINKCVTCFGLEYKEDQEAKDIVQLIKNQFYGVSEHITEEFIEKMKSRLISEIVLSQENTMNRSGNLLKQYIAYGDVKTVEEINNTILSISKSDIDEICKDVVKNFENNNTFASIGKKPIPYN